MGIDAWDPETTQQLRAIFADEAAEHLAVLHEQLGRIGRDQQALPEALRRAHTLKGSAATVGFFCLQRAAHRLEEALVRLRERDTPIDEDALERLIAASELLAPIVRARELSTAEALAERFARELDAWDDELDGAPGADGPSEARRRKERRQLPERRSEDLNTIRLGVSRVESLMGAVGDLLLDRSRIERRAEEVADAARRIVLLRQALHAALGRASGARNDVLGLPAIDAELQDIAHLLEEAAGGMLEDSAGLGEKTRLLQQELTQVRMMSVAWLFARLRRQLHDLCLAEAKEVELFTEGEETEIDRLLLERITDPMIHLLANAVAHGIERPDVRRATGKPARGKVFVSARQEGEYLLLRVEDDGAGIDREAVRAAAEEQQLLGPESSAFGADELLDAIFLPGLSTRSQADRVAGRGVGLDVVRRSVAALGGDVSVRSERGAGTSFSIRLPLTSMIMRVMLVSEAGQLFAIPQAHVLEDRVPDDAAWREGAEGPEVETRWGWLPVFQLSELLGAPACTDPVLLAIAFGSSHFVLACEQLRGPRDAVLKRLGPLLGRLPILSGAMVGRGGAIHFVLDVAGIYHLARPAAEGGDERRGAITQRRVLVVDDSAAIRETVGALLREAGYEVTMARDGLEAWAQLRGGRFDLLLTDLEMPRLHGLALIERCRQSRRTAALPILVLSSRTAPHSRREVREAGADAFLAKPVNRQRILERVALLLDASRA